LRSIAHRHSFSGFTLVELLSVIFILGLLSSLLAPAITSVRSKAESSACISNLRQIGISIWLWIPENGNIFPPIENDPKKPIYGADDNAKSLYKTLQPYGMQLKTLACPTDLHAGGKSILVSANDADMKDQSSGNASGLSAGQNSFFAKYGCSYECPPWAADSYASKETVTIYRPGGNLEIPNKRVTLAWDYGNVHDGGFNRLKANNTVEYKSLNPNYR
jgi:prepilin-type N-terminal cleavage/methylation domain-containing protein